MDDITFETVNYEYTCPECKNKNAIEEEKAVNDVIECEYCGIEFRVNELIDEGQYKLEILEEEK